MSFSDLRASRAARQTSHAQHVTSSSPSEATEPPIESLNLNKESKEPIRLEDLDSASPTASSSHTTLDDATTRGLGLDKFGVEVRKTKKRGRGLFAGKKGYKPGDRILRVPERAIASALGESQLAHYCSGCYLGLRDVKILANQTDDEGAKGLLRCGGCKAVHYCSKLHAPECKALSILRERDRAGRDPMLGDGWIPLQYFRAFGRFVWARKKWLDNHPGEGEWPQWEQYLLMQPHIDTSPTKLGEFKHVASQLQEYLSTSPAHDPNFPLADLIQLTSRLQTNAFTLTAPDLTPIGVLLSPPAAMSNHSCYPNAVIEFPMGGGIVDFIAIGDIAPGEEILTTYIDASCPRSTRQNDVFETFGFQCTCTLCEATSPDQNPPGLETRWCLSHANCSKNGRIPMPKAVYPESVDALITALDQQLGWEGKAKGKCDGCGEQVEMDIKELPELVKQGMELIEKDTQRGIRTHFGGQEKAIESVSNLLSSLGKYMPTHSFPCVPLLRLLFRLHLPVTPETIESAISAITRAIEAAPAIYPPNYPAVAVLLAERASILAAYPHEPAAPPHPRVLAGRISNTFDAATMALRACEKSFGMAGRGGILGLKMSQIAETNGDLVRRIQARLRDVGSWDRV